MIAEESFSFVCPLKFQNNLCVSSVTAGLLVNRQMSGTAGPISHTWMHSHFMDDPPNVMEDEEWRAQYLGLAIARPIFHAPTEVQWSMNYPHCYVAPFVRWRNCRHESGCWLDPKSLSSLLISKHGIDGAAREKRNKLTSQRTLRFMYFGPIFRFRVERSEIRLLLRFLNIVHHFHTSNRQEQRTHQRRSQEMNVRRSVAQSLGEKTE